VRAPPPLPDPGFSARLATPFAVLGIRAAGGKLLGIDYLPRGAATLAPLDRFAERVCRQLECYLDDPGYRFDLPFDYRGTAFQCKVLRAIAAIPCGRTLTHAGVARAIGSAARPVGGACGADRMPIVIPCHRVLGSNGIGGFMHARAGFPLDVKRWLLAHEGASIGA